MKKRGFAWVLVLILLFSVSACSNEGNTTPGTKEETAVPSFISLTVGDMLIEEWVEENITCRVSWDKLRLSDEEREKYPKLQDAFDEINEKTHTEAKALVYELSSAAKEPGTNNEGYISCEGSSSIWMQRADSELVSYVEEEYVFSGGVHPDYGTFSRCSFLQGGRRKRYRCTMVS